MPRGQTRRFQYRKSITSGLAPWVEGHQKQKTATKKKCFCLAETQLFIVLAEGHTTGCQQKAQLTDGFLEAFLSWCAFYCSGRHQDWKQHGEGRSLVGLLVWITVHRWESQARNWSRSKGRKRGETGLLSVSGSATLFIPPKAICARLYPQWVGLSYINPWSRKWPTDMSTIWWRHFLEWGSFRPANSSLWQANQK